MRIPKSPLPVVFLALIYADMDRTEEARATVQDIFKVSPGFSAKGFVNSMMPYKDRTKSERDLATLLQLGLPE